MEGEPEVHTTELTALSAADDDNIMDQLTSSPSSPSPSRKGQSSDEITKPPVVARLPPFFKAADRSMPPTEQQPPPLTQQQQQQQQQQQFSSFSSSSLFSSSHSDSSSFTAAWVASTSFAAVPVDLSLHFLAPKVTTTTVTSASSSRVVGTTTTTTSMGIQQHPQQQQQQQQPQQQPPHFITPSLGIVRYPPHGSSVSGNDHLGRHWKQMGCQTRQYLQPTIPLPASSRLASAAKHLRGASLGGPPGSLSPLTPSKSWAQIVASSPSRPRQPQQQTPSTSASEANNGKPLVATAAATAKPGSGGAGSVRYGSLVSDSGVAAAAAGAGDGRCSRASSFSNSRAAPPPSHGGSGGGCGRQGKNGLRGIAGLGVSTSSNRDFKSLLLRLKTALDKEKERWRSKGVDGAASAPSLDDRSCSDDNNKNNNKNNNIDGKQRDECIFWLAWILRKFQFSAETMSLSVALFDAVLTESSRCGSGSNSGIFSVSPKCCKLVALVCMMLSAKFSEEDADVPTTKDLLAVSEVGDLFSVDETLKMERAILVILDWDLNRSTPLKFLEIIHTLLFCHQPQLLEDVALGLTPTKHLERLTWKMQRIVANHQVALGFRPAIVAVASLSVDLEAIDVTDWQLVTVTLEKICQIEGEDRHQLTKCRNLIVRLLSAGERKSTSSTTTATSGGRGGGRGIEAEMEIKRLAGNAKLKRKHVPSESAETTTEGGSVKPTAVSTTKTKGTTLKRVFNIAESPCKSEARCEEEAAKKSVAATERFQALQGLCINIY